MPSASGREARPLPSPACRPAVRAGLRRRLAMAHPVGAGESAEMHEAPAICDLGDGHLRRGGTRPPRRATTMPSPRSIHPRRSTSKRKALVKSWRKPRLECVLESRSGGWSGGVITVGPPDQRIGRWEAGPPVPAERAHRNRPGGYWIAEAVPEAAGHAIRWPRSKRHDDKAIAVIDVDGA